MEEVVRKEEEAICRYMVEVVTEMVVVEMCRHKEVGVRVRVVVGIYIHKVGVVMVMVVEETCRCMEEVEEMEKVVVGTCRHKAEEEMVKVVVGTCNHKVE